MCSILKNRFWCHKSSDTFIGPLPVSPPGATGSRPGPQSERVQSPVHTLRGPHPPDPHPACRATGALGSRHPVDARRPVPEQHFLSQLCPAGDGPQLGFPRLGSPQLGSPQLGSPRPVVMGSVLIC